MIALPGELLPTEAFYRMSKSPQIKRIRQRWRGLEPFLQFLTHKKTLFKLKAQIKVMRRKAVSPIKAAVAVVAILIILGAAGFAALLFVPGFSSQMTQYTGVNFNQTFHQISSGLNNLTTKIGGLGMNTSKVEGVTVLTNNATLKKAIYIGNGVPQGASPVFLEPNTTYVFNVTVVALNGLGQPLPNAHVNMSVLIGSYPSYINGTPVTNNNILQQSSNWVLWKNLTSSEWLNPTHGTINGTTPFPAQIIIRIPAGYEAVILINAWNYTDTQVFTNIFVATNST